MTKYRYHVVYESGFVNYTGSNVDDHYFNHLEPNDIMNTPGFQTLTWELNDLPLTQKFIDAYKQKNYQVAYDLFVRKRKRSWRAVTDIYKGLTAESVLESRTEMNNIIEYLNTEFQDKIWFTIPSELKLNDQDLYDKRDKNLNELHDHFETRMIELESKRSRGEIDLADANILWEKLQSINLIVHFNERLGNENNIDELEHAEESYFTTIKFDVPTRSTILLEPDDYKDFTMVRPAGSLMLDFGTVGKDLFTCSVTNDAELVYKNMISQQWELNPWVQYDWASCSEKEWDDQMQLYNAWIDEYKIADYLDLTDPKYTPGRHQLGDCISHNFTNASQFIDEIISKTPKIHAFFITDENNISIL